MGSMKTRSFLSLIVSFSVLLFLSSLFSSNPLTVIYNGSFKLWHPSAGDQTVINDDCDLFEGKWVRDHGGPAYTNRSCRILPESQNCDKYGKDQDFVNWRWKPAECDLRRFDPVAFLEAVRGKTMAFASDSVGRNQKDSLVCLLSQASICIIVEYPLNLKGDKEENQITNWYFQSYDFTLMLLWTRFLVQEQERVVNGTGTGDFDLHLDRVDTNWTEKLPLVNYLIISSGHWFFRNLYLYENGKIIGCVYCGQANLTNYDFTYAIRRAFRTALQSIDRCEECEGLVTLVRTFAPAHFEHGAWNTGGYCNRTGPLNETAVRLSGTDWEVRNAQVEELESFRMEKTKWFGVLDVTKSMLLRADGHPGSHWNNDWNRGFNDCLHWCLPGPIDTWNEMLLALLRRGFSDV
ncbi:hypothetical protein ZIOFF_073932 [Zingiber officinale]|uniref:Trichome birefringence-like N-terminal domain-containing protein n=1 Tax=Zingiber officinale TaxID=94328 RepID=A0A8J5C1X0_ZINOF|nr:hypothetical protein ZIOFF_073932 [Zingiber officinale]